MPILGAHMSIAGGFHRAVERAAAAGCDCVQIFSKNNNQWQAREMAEAEVAEFQRALVENNIHHPLVHTSYLINIASPDSALWKQSVDALVVELHRAERLTIPYVVLHPGAYTQSDEQAGINAIVRALDELFCQTRALRCGCLLETTAGQGTNLGWRFEQLGAMLDGVQEPDRLGVCLDTCHVFAAGYRLHGERQYQDTLAQLKKWVGFGRVRAIHLNDSQRARGSRVDRHAHIGQGKLGWAPFRRLLNDPRFRRVPMYLETPKGELDGLDADVRNLQALRRLVRTRKK